jgi:hypothetical protein
MSQETLQPHEAVGLVQQASRVDNEKSRGLSA